MLNPFYVLDWAHSCDGRDFLWVGFDAALGDDEAEQHAPRDPENTLLRIEFDAIYLGFRKGLLKIDNEVVGPLGLDHDVINIGLNGLPDEVPEAFEHTALVHSPSILQSKRALKRSRTIRRG